MELDRFRAFLVLRYVMAFYAQDVSSGDGSAEEAACLKQAVTGMKHVNNYTKATESAM
jgi:hypothetical protein